MIQEHLDTRVFRKAEGPMIVAGATISSARARCIREAKHRRLVHVCSWCVAGDVKQALDDLENVSHGVCTPCMAKLMEEPR